MIKKQHCQYPSTHTSIQRPNWNNFWQKTTCISDKALCNWALFISNEDTSQEEVCSYATLSKLAVVEWGIITTAKIKNTAKVLALTSSALITTTRDGNLEIFEALQLIFFFFFLQKANENQSNTGKKMEKWYLTSRLSNKRTTFVISRSVSKKEALLYRPIISAKFRGL